MEDSNRESSKEDLQTNPLKENLNLSSLEAGKYRAGTVGVLGLPNAGKSTLVNALVGEKVGIVTSKPQTTRQRVLGILTVPEEAQFVFVDAPGWIQAEKKLNAFLQKEFEEVVKKSDVLVVVLNVDAKTPEEFEELLELARKSGKPWMVAISKMDLPQSYRSSLIQIKVRDYNVPCVLVSAKKNRDTWKSKFLSELKEMLPISDHPLYPPEDYTTQTIREISSEIIREKCFEFLHHEIPFNLAIQIDKFEEGSSLIKIYAVILLNRESHKPMVIGQGAKMIKRIGTEARKDIEELLDGKKLFLDCHVKVRPLWMENSQQMKDLGYVVL